MLGSGDSITAQPCNRQPRATWLHHLCTGCFWRPAQVRALRSVRQCAYHRQHFFEKPELWYFITCTATTSDIDGDSIALSYQWNNLSTSTTLGSNPSLTFDASMGTGGDEIECTATATDTYGATASSAISVCGLTEPTFVNAASSPNSGITTSSVLTCNGLAGSRWWSDHPVPTAGPARSTVTWHQPRPSLLTESITQPADQINAPSLQPTSR